MKRNHLLIGAIALVIIMAAGYIAWDRHQTKTLGQATLTQIENATQALRAASATGTDPVAKSQALAAAADRVDRDLAALRATNLSRIPQLAAGADTYLHTARELLKRQTALLVLDSGLRHGIATFREHLRNGNRTAATWTRTAVEQKNRLEKDFREYQSTIDAHARIVDGLPDARKALATLTPEHSLITAEEVEGLRAAVRSTAAAITADMEALRRIAAPR